MADFEAAYLELLRTGELNVRAELARAHETACDLCARECGVDRAVKVGACRTGLQAYVASFGPHHGEEIPLRGWQGSGTIFFSFCNLRCVYCQNHDISQAPAGHPVNPEELAAMMLSLQDMGCHNINLVSPSHVVAEILSALDLAAKAGLHLPLVFNTGGYDSLAALQLLDGVIDIYMPDMKYGETSSARKFSKIKSYPIVNQRAVTEMHRQVGELQIDDKGLARRGLLVRHLVLPHGLAGTRKVMEFIAREISTETYVNLMNQYHPAHLAPAHPALNRMLSQQEYAAALRIARQAGLHRFDQ
jgi:putative pyruvate formate lyase activating enzyme